MEKKENAQSEMKECFGVCFGWFMEDLIGDEKQVAQCYHCGDYEKCYKMASIRALTQLRFEIRRASISIGRAIGGSHSAYPFG